VLTLVLLMSLGVFGQFQLRSRLIVRRDLIRAQAAQMTAQLAAPDNLRTQIQRLDTRADLLAELQLHPAPTRLLAAVANSLPASVSLTACRLSREASGVQLPAEKKSGRRNAAASDIQPEAKDLQVLKEQSLQEDLFLTLDGLAPDDVSVSQYLAALQETGLFAEVRLAFTDHHRRGEYDLRCFAVRLRVRDPGVEPILSEQRIAEPLARAARSL
jgi:Tfp pilus assembly protein PilN